MDCQLDGQLVPGFCLLLFSTFRVGKVFSDGSLLPEGKKDTFLNHTSGWELTFSFLFLKQIELRIVSSFVYF